MSNRPKDHAAMTARKALHKGKATCTICGKRHANTVVDGKMVNSGHIGLTN